MSKEEQELLIRIAQTVGDLFRDIKKDPNSSEITLDQSICAELWDDYDAWVEYLGKE